jgi:hypothetical protein
MKIGDTVWVWDGNVRVYKDKGGGPDFRSSFVAHVITAETKASWLLDGEYSDALKVDKKTLLLRGANLYGKNREIYTSAEQVDSAVFVHDEIGKIVDAVRQCHSAEKLRAIQELLR